MRRYESCESHSTDADEGSSDIDVDVPSYPDSPVVRATRPPEAAAAFLTYEYHSGDREMECAMLAFQFAKEAGLVSSVRSSGLVRGVVKLLHLCRFDTEDVRTWMALALANIKKQHAVVSVMSDQEKCMVCILHIYLAHSYLSDDYVPMSAFYKHFFKAYCTTRCVRLALIKLWSLQDYKLGAPEDEVADYVKLLSGW